MVSVVRLVLPSCERPSLTMRAIWEEPNPVAFLTSTILFSMCSRRRVGPPRPEPEPRYAFLDEASYDPLQLPPAPSDHRCGLCPRYPQDGVLQDGPDDGAVPPPDVFLFSL